MSQPVDILVVDDDERNLLAAEALLGDMGVRVVKARSGREALRLLMSRTFPLIILDVQMPDMDGFETAQLIRDAPKTAHIPIVFLTANQDVERAQVGYARGAVDYLFKPIVPEVLRAKVAVFVELHRMRARELELTVEQERRRWQAVWLEEKLEQERAAAEALSAALEQTRQALAARDQFLRMASHELRTPLTSMRISVENTLRRTGDLPAETGGRVTRTLKLLGSQIERLSKLVEELLSAVVIQAGRLQLAPGDAELGEVVRAAVEDLRHSIDAAGCAVSVEVAADTPVALDRFWVQQAIGNLMTNALKFGAGKPIVVRAGAQGGRAFVVVRDQGIGIPRDEQAKIFEPFEHATSTENYGGMGLGLYIVQRIIEDHGGRVTVESDPGQGAAFKIELPLRAATQPGQGTADARVASPWPQEAPEPAPAGGE